MGEGRSNEVREETRLTFDLCLEGLVGRSRKLHCLCSSVVELVFDLLMREVSVDGLLHRQLRERARSGRRESG